MSKRIVACRRTIGLLLGCVLGMSVLWALPAEAQVMWKKGEDNAPLWLGQGQPLIKAFAGGVSPILKGATFVRLGVRWDGPQHISLMARYSQDAKTWTSWLPMQRPWEEGTVHNSHGDPPAGTAKYAQLKVVGEGWPTFIAAELIPVLGPYQYKPALTVVPPKDTTGGVSTQAFGLTGPFNARSKWGASPAKCTTNNNTKTRIAIHHTDTPNNDTVSPAVRLRGIQNFHQNTRGWCDIGYHLLISQDGQAWEGTPAEFLGTHVGGNNTNTLGISFIGDFTALKPDIKMLCTGARLIDWTIKTYGVKRDRSVIMGHRQFQGNSTTCPGDKLYAEIGFMITQSSGSTCQAPPPPKCDYVKINTATLNIRSDANTNQAPIGTVSLDTCLKVEAKKDGQSVSGNTTWFKITHAGVTGWVSAVYADCSNCGPPADTKAPTIKITAPTEGQRFQSLPITVKGEAKDDVAVTKVEVDGKAAALSNGDTFQIDLTLPPGTHKITATAWDKAGNKASASVTVTYAPASTEAPQEAITDAGTEPPQPDTATPGDQASNPDTTSTPEETTPQDNATTPDPSTTPDTRPAPDDGKIILDGTTGPACNNNADCTGGLVCTNQQCTPANPTTGGGCGCQSQDPAPALWGLLLLLLLGIGRRSFSS